jgi:hypothetical protein
MNHTAVAPAAKSSAINSKSMPPCCGGVIPALRTGGLAEFVGDADLGRGADELRCAADARATGDGDADEVVLVGEDPANRAKAALAARWTVDPSDPSGLAQRPSPDALLSPATARRSSCPSCWRFRRRSFATCWRL